MMSSYFDKKYINIYIYDETILIQIIQKDDQLFALSYCNTCNFHYQLCTLNEHLL